MKVQYTGSSDFYELDAADLKKAGVEGFRKTSFPKGVSVEVSDEVGAVLVSEDDEIFADFPFQQVHEEQEELVEEDVPVEGDGTGPDTVDEGPNPTPAAGPEVPGTPSTPRARGARART